MIKYEECLENCSKTVKETLNKLSNTKADAPTSQAYIEMWRSKSAILSTLYQTLTDRQVTLMKERFKKYQEKVDNPQSTIVMDFEGSIKQLTKMYNEAKDNVKFLTTLERQFRALGTTGLVGV